METQSIVERGRDTPRTDELRAKHKAGIGNTFYGEMEQHACQLERELAEAKRFATSPPWTRVSDRIPAFNYDVIWAYGDDGDGTHFWQATCAGLNDPAWVKRYKVTHWRYPDAAIDAVKEG